MFQISDYSLPDIKLLEKKVNQFLLWIPDKTYIVLGASDKPDESLYLDNVNQDSITVIKRPSGGKSVLLSPDTMVIAVVFFDEFSMHPKNVFQNINSLLISALEQAGVKNLALKGISDIVINDKKILGSAIYKNKNMLFYHAVLNLGEPANTFERYLKHPTREPAYRKSRKHTDFITSIKDNGYSESYNKIQFIISDIFLKSKYNFEKKIFRLQRFIKS